MSDKLKELEFKRLFQEYNFLSIDEEYKKEFILEKNSVFIDDIKKLILEEPELKKFINPSLNNESIINNDLTQNLDSAEVKAYLDSPKDKNDILDWLLNKEERKENISDSINFNQDSIPNEEQNLNNEENIDENLLNKIKFLFRTIAKKTHPDKAGNNQYADIYIKAKNAYDKNDIHELYSICIKLGIHYEIDNFEQEKFKLKNKYKKEEITKLETSFVWLYFNNNDVELKKQLLRVFLVQHGFRFKSTFGL